MRTSEAFPVDLLALSGVAGVVGLGDDGLAHVWKRVRHAGTAVSELYDFEPERLQTDFGLSLASAKYLREHARDLRLNATDLLERAQQVGIVVLLPGQKGYPADVDVFYEGESPLIYARGNLNLLNSSRVAIVNSAEAPPGVLARTLAIASRLAEAGQTLVTGTQNPAYNLVGLAAKRAVSNIILVLHQGLLTAMNGQPQRELVPLARHENENFDPERTLVISPFRLEGIWQKGNGCRRDRLLFSLAQSIVSVAVRNGGVIDTLCREAILLKRHVFVNQEATYESCNSGNQSLISSGAFPLIIDEVASNCDLVLKTNTTRTLGSEVAPNDLERRRAIGQFFTPLSVARFMWSFLEKLQGRRFRKGIRLIDPACGEGVFLRVAAEAGGLPASSLFGIDVDESLVPIWRADPLLCDARLFRTNGLVNNSSIGLEPGSFDVVIGNPPFSGTGLRDLLKLTDSSALGRQNRELDLFGTEALKEQPADSPPEVPQHDRAILDFLVRQLSRYACWRLNITVEDEQAPAAESTSQNLFAEFDFSDRRRPVASDYERMARFIAGWAADQPLDASKSEVRDTIRRLASTSIEVFFTERFIQLARPGGLIAVIVPQSIVASDQLAPLRAWLLRQIELVAVIGLPRKVFTGVGANANTSIIFGRRLATELSEATVSASERRILMAAPDTDAGESELAAYFDRILTSDFAKAT